MAGINGSKVPVGRLTEHSPDHDTPSCLLPDAVRYLLSQLARLLWV